MRVMGVIILKRVSKKPLEGVNVTKLYTKVRWILFSWCTDRHSVKTRRQSELLRRTALACADGVHWYRDSSLGIMNYHQPLLLRYDWLYKCRTDFMVELLSLPRALYRGIGTPVETQVWSREASFITLLVRSWNGHWLKVTIVSL